MGRCALALSPLRKGSRPDLLKRAHDSSLRCFTWLIHTRISTLSFAPILFFIRSWASSLFRRLIDDWEPFLYLKDWVELATLSTILFRLSPLFNLRSSVSREVLFLMAGRSDSDVSSTVHVSPRSAPHLPRLLSFVPAPRLVDWFIRSYFRSQVSLLSLLSLSQASLVSSCPTPMIGMASQSGCWSWPYSKHWSYQLLILITSLIARAEDEWSQNRTRALDSISLPLPLLRTVEAKKE